MNSVNLERLPEYLKRQHWFAGKTLPIKSCTIIDSIELDKKGAPGLVLLIVQVVYELGQPDRYLLPVRVDADGNMHDQLEFEELPRLLFQLIREGARVESGGSGIKGETIGDPGMVSKGVATVPAIRHLGVKQTNTSLVIDDKVIFKVIRKLELGLNPELEIGRFLATKTSFRATPTLLGALELEGASATTVGLLHEFIASSGDAWKWINEALLEPLPLPETILGEIELLGQRVAELHRALASDPSDLAFAPEPLLQEDLQRWSSSIIGELGVTLARASTRFPEVADRREALVERANVLARARPSGMKLRQHGDLHLGHVLRSLRGWLIIDFEGEPTRAFDQRREKHSPLRDVAGMLRSFAYASAGAKLADEHRDPVNRALRERFLSGYLGAMAGSGLLPDEDTLGILLDALELEKALYEVRYELQMRPDWVHIPIGSLMAQPQSSSGVKP